MIIRYQYVVVPIELSVRQQSKKFDTLLKTIEDLVVENKSLKNKVNELEKITQESTQFVSLVCKLFSLVASLKCIIAFL